VAPLSAELAIRPRIRGLTRWSDPDDLGKIRFRP
jgi:hypothetical protein